MARDPSPTASLDRWFREEAEQEYPQGIDESPEAYHERLHRVHQSLMGYSLQKSMTRSEDDPDVDGLFVFGDER